MLPFSGVPPTTPAQLRPRIRGPTGVPPHVTTTTAPVPADRDQLRRWPPTERLVFQPPGRAVLRRALATAAVAAPPRPSSSTTRHAKTARSIPGAATGLQTEFVQAAERRQISAAPRIGHVELFRVSRIGGSLHPRKASTPVPATTLRHPYTLRPEDPVWLKGGSSASGDPVRPVPTGRRRLAPGTTAAAGVTERASAAYLLTHARRPSSDRPPGPFRSTSATLPRAPTRMRCARPSATLRVLSSGGTATHGTWAPIHPEIDNLPCREAHREQSFEAACRTNLAPVFRSSGARRGVSE